MKSTQSRSVVVVSVLLLLVGSGTTLAQRPSGLSARVEILPGIADKWIDPILAEPLPVVVFGDEALDVREIDPATLVLAGAAVTKYDDGSLVAYDDVDSDGIVDLVVRFASRQLRLGERSTRALLSGRTTDGRFVSGSGVVPTIEKARAERRFAAPLGGAAEKLPPIRVQIEVLPGELDKRIELGNRGTVSVAVLSAPDFDATGLDPAALHLAGSPVTRRQVGGLASFEDVNADGLRDLVVEVPKKLLRLDAASEQAVLTGFTPEGRFLTGSGRISIAETATMTFDSDDAKPPLEPQSIEWWSGNVITINDAAPASPYPSSITVSGVPGVISKVRVTLNSLTHTYPNDVDVLLVGPTGQSIVLMSDVGGTGPGVSDVTLTFDDDSAFVLDPSVTPATGTYRPSDFGSGDAFPPPAPVPTAATMLQAFNSTSPNGTWNLYVVDDAGNDAGFLGGGWSLDFVLASQFCTAGPITINDATTAAPYPSTITVAGLTGVVSKVTATLKGLTHSRPIDLDVLLYAPGGPWSMLMSDTGGSSAVSGRTVVLDDNAPYPPSANFLDGTYQPEDVAPGDSLPGPAPAGPYLVGFGVFVGHPNPSGTWNVYIADDQAGSAGSLTRFCIDITTMTPIDNGNFVSITIPAGSPGTTSGPSLPYPSNIQVSGVIGTLQKVTVTLQGLLHSFPKDLDILLKAPNVGSVLLMSDVGGGNPGANNVTYTFDDNAVGPIPTGVNAGSGVYKISNDDTEGPDALPAPAPAGPYGSSLLALTGLSPNGTWSLYVFDDAGGDVGRIIGWTVTMRTYLLPYVACATPSMTIPAGAPSTTQGPSSPYPTVLPYQPIPVDVNQYKLTVDLLGLTHSYPRDLDVLLVGPQGQKVMLMSDVAGAGPGVSNVNLTFDDDAPAVLPPFGNPASGRYKPNDQESDTMPAPAPAGPYGTSLSVFKGTNPIGTWSLYVADDATGDFGSLTSWCLRFETSISAGQVTNLKWIDKEWLAWDSGPNATSYNLYRGITSEGLPFLANSLVDSCLRETVIFPQHDALTEVTSAGTFYWYLVRGNNAQGEGPAGFARFGPLILARIQNSSGSCP